MVAVRRAFLTFSDGNSATGVETLMFLFLEVESQIRCSVKQVCGFLAHFLLKKRKNMLNLMDKKKLVSYVTIGVYCINISYQYPRQTIRAR